MNFKSTFAVLIFALGVQSAFASFPVQRQAAATEQTVSTGEATQAEQATVSQAKAEKSEAVTYAPVVGSQKSQGIALILALLLGGLAAHRWYLGKKWWINLIFIITLGGLGIWWIIDVIRIITGGLAPENGSYKSSFF